MVGARAPILAVVVASTASRMIAAMGSFPSITVGAPVGIDCAAYVTVVAETLMYRDSGVLPAAWRCLVNGRVLGGAHQGRTLAGVRIASSGQRTLRQLCRRTLEQRANLAVARRSSGVAASGRPWSKAIVVAMFWLA